MNKFAILAVAGAACTANAQLIISEIVDATQSGGLPKFVEITNTSGSAIDLSAYSIGNFNNGGTTLGGGASFQLDGILAAGDSWVISYENGDEPGIGTFFDVYGFDPDEFGLGSFINGDDVVALFFGNATGDGTDATIVDQYGVIGVNGDGEVWDYTDSYAFRLPDFINGNGGSFDASQWFFAGLDALEGLDAAGIAAVTTPGTHSFIPTPGVVALAGVAGLVSAGRRRR
jgi:hypothetical protein